MLEYTIVPKQSYSTIFVFTNNITVKRAMAAADNLWKFCSFNKK